MASWLKKYLTYTYRSEAPEEFHLWTGLATLAATLERRVWADTGHGYKIYPNLYVVLVGQTGQRKSSASDFGPPLAEDIGVPVYRDKITMEALIDELRSNMQFEEGKCVKPAATWVYASELGTLLGRRAVDGDLLKQLTHWYMCPDKSQYKTRTRGREYLTNVCVNLLGATVPQLFRMWDEEVLVSGFLARLVTVWGAGRRTRSLFYDSDEDMDELRRELVEELQEIRRLSGEVQFTGECRVFLNAWYAERELPDDERMDGFWDREHDLVIKIATLFAVSEGRGLEVDVPQVEAAIWTLNNIKQGLRFVYSGVGTHQLSAHLDRIAGQLKERQEGMTKAELLRKNWYSVRREDLEEVLATLIAAEKVGVEKVGRRWRYVWKEPSGEGGFPEKVR